MAYQSINDLDQIFPIKIADGFESERISLTKTLKKRLLWQIK